MSIPKGDISKKDTSIKVLKETRAKLRTLEKELGFANYNALFNYVCLELTREGLIPPASYEMVFEKMQNRPILLTGESGAGKTTTIKSMLAAWAGNVFLIDVSNEYEELEAVDLGKLYALDWSKGNQRVRFVPNKNVEASKGEGTAVFSQLNYLMHSGSLRNWVIVIEEGHRFAGDPNLRALLTEARKFVRKVILVTTDWRVYEGIAKVFKPQPQAS